ncbi:hypothetical protein M9H77_22330 [Catharanthus roseus]|uniref:Uncharacterized protein n=1 Tax=Catharanthus roseus TaxID=4058 RepID=A0ACC0ARD6_CATRO|nr:hypothetical protein M9H77_22330 [Catharanthus roseus]
MNKARRHTRRGGRQYSRTGCRGVVAKGATSTLAGLAREDGRGLHTVGTVCPTASTEGTMGRYMIRQVLGEAKYQELKFRLTVCNRYRGAWGRQQQLHVFGSFGIFHNGLQGLYRERERRLWGYMQQAQERFTSFMTSFISQCGVQLDLVPTLFPHFLPSDDDTISQPPTGPPSCPPLSPAPPPQAST